MNDAVRRFRRRFEGCDSSLWLRDAKAFRELLPKMLLRLSLDIPRLSVGARSPARARRHDYRMQKGSWKREAVVASEDILGKYVQGPGVEIGAGEQSRAQNGGGTNQGVGATGDNAEDNGGTIRR